MKDEDKTKEQLLDELSEMRQKIAGIDREETVRSFLDAVQQTMLLIDTEGTVILCNEVAATRLGTTAEQIIGTCLFDHFPPEIAGIRKGHYDKVVATGEPVFFEDTRMGRHFEHYCYPVFDKGGDAVRGITIFAPEVTARKKTHEALRESEERYRSMFEHAIEGLYQTTPDGRFIKVNPALARMMGFASPEEMVAAYTDLGKQHYVDPADRKKFTSLLEQQRNIQGFETQLRKKDGRPMWASISARAVFDQGARYSYYEGVVIDITERKGMENALMKEKETLSAVLEHHPAGVALVDPQGAYLYINQEFSRITGFTIKDIRTGREWFRKAYPDREYRKTAIDTWQKDRSSYAGSAVDREFLITRRDGEKRVVNIRTTFLDEFSIMVLSDVTDRKETEEALYKSNERLRLILEAINDGLWDWNIPTGEGIFSPSYYTMLGYEPYEFAQNYQNFRDLIHPHDLESTEKEIEECVERKEGFAIELRMKRKRGGWLWVLTRGRIVERDALGRPVRMVGAHIDIAERKEAEEILRQSEEMYRTLIAASPDAIAVVSLSGTMTFISQKGLQLYGISSGQDAVGRNIFEWIAPEHRQEARELLEHLFATGEALPREFVVSREDGTRIVVEVHAAPLQSSDGFVRGAIIIIRDVTERKSLEAQLLQAQKMEAIGTLAGGVAHDFNNILMAMMGYTGLMGMKIGENHELRTYISQIQDCASRAANITRSLLAFSRKQTMQIAPQKANAIVGDLEKLLRRLLPEDVELTVSLNGDATVMADTTQIDQVLINLVSNAKDAMPRGGRLHIQTELASLDKEFKEMYGFGNPGEYLVISVADSGLGMDKNTQNKIFEPFFTTKEAGKGTGLGLSIVYGITKQHNGYITVSSEPGKGTTFRVYLPTAKATIAETLERTEPTRRGTETILLAEDDGDVRQIAREMLSAFGYRVLEAGNGVEAIKKYAENAGAIDLLVFDVVMPEMNGKEAYEEILKINSSVRVLFMSGYLGDVILDKGIEAFDYILKPLSADDLQRKIREILDR